MSTALDPALKISYIRLSLLLNKGHSRIVSAAFLDWLSREVAWADKVRTLPNPNRVGLLDEFIAFTTFDCMHFNVDGILKHEGQLITATVSCGRAKNGTLDLWFVGFNNACAWKKGLTEMDIVDMIAKKEIRLSDPAIYTNGKEIGT